MLGVDGDHLLAAARGRLGVQLLVVGGLVGLHEGRVVRRFRLAHRVGSELLLAHHGLLDRVVGRRLRVELHVILRRVLLPRLLYQIVDRPRTRLLLRLFGTFLKLRTLDVSWLILDELLLDIDVLLLVGF